MTTLRHCRSRYDTAGVYGVLERVARQVLDYDLLRRDTAAEGHLAHRARLSRGRADNAARDQQIARVPVEEHGDTVFKPAPQRRTRHAWRRHRGTQHDHGINHGRQYPQAKRTPKPL